VGFSLVSQKKRCGNWGFVMNSFLSFLFSMRDVLLCFIVVYYIGF
jgi:hypothetical protein